MSEHEKDSATLFGIYKLHAELAEQASSSRESLNKVYSGMITAVVAGSVLIHRLAPDSDMMWVLPILGIAISLSWMMSLHSATGRLSAKHKVLLELESRLPFEFLQQENTEFNQLRIVRRKWTGLLMPGAFLVISSAWLITLIFENVCNYIQPT